MPGAEEGRIKEGRKASLRPEARRERKLRKLSRARSFTELRAVIGNQSLVISACWSEVRDQTSEIRER